MLLIYLLFLAWLVVAEGRVRDAVGFVVAPAGCGIAFGAMHGSVEAAALGTMFAALACVAAIPVYLALRRLVPLAFWNVVPAAFLTAAALAVFRPGGDAREWWQAGLVGAAGGVAFWFVACLPAWQPLGPLRLRGFRSSDPRLEGIRIDPDANGTPRGVRLDGASIADLADLRLGVAEAVGRRFRFVVDDAGVAPVGRRLAFHGVVVMDDEFGPLAVPEADAA